MSKWKSSFGASIIINGLLLIGGALYINYAAPEPDAKPEPVEIELVADAPSGGAPQISAPKQEKVDIPPAPSPEQIQQIKNGVAVDDVLQQQNPSPTPSPTATPGTPGNPTANPSPTPGPGLNPSPDPGPGPEPKEDKSRGPRATYRAKPSYQFATGEKGPYSAHVDISIDENGNVSGVSLDSSSGNAKADAAIEAAAWEWTFLPALDSDGNPRPTSVGVTITVE